MISQRKLALILDQVMSGRGVPSFSDFESLLLALGFRMDRQSGSHRIYSHPRLVRPFPVQPAGRDAKRYQVRELRDIIVRHRLQIGIDE